MMQFQTGVLIGRFQPFHFGHMHLVRSAFLHCQELIIVIGSMYRARSARNPFTYDERRQLILTNLQTYDQEHGTDFATRVRIEGVRDYLYAEEAWLQDVIEGVEKHVTPGSRVGLIGHDKDASTYYLKKFPRWGYIELPNFEGINATDLRKAYFGPGIESISKALPEPSMAFLHTFKEAPEYAQLKSEWAYIQRVKKSWSTAPYPPILVTTDSVVLCEEHILLVQRAGHPGRGLWALPGGFLEQGEWIKEGLFRELKEETSILLSDHELKASLVSMLPFDHPERAQVGRVITHAGLLRLNGPLPYVEATDDAKSVMWWPIVRLPEMENKMHDDHYQIIQYFLKLQ